MLSQPPAPTNPAQPIAQASNVEPGSAAGEAASTGPSLRLSETVMPRYRYSAARTSASDPGVRMMFRVPVTTVSNVRHDPFSAVIVTPPSHGFGQAPREQTRYVLPVVNHASARDRIF